MSERRSNRGRNDGPQFQRGPQRGRAPAPVAPPSGGAQAALPAPGSATAVASGAAGPPRPVLPYDRPHLDSPDDSGAPETPEEQRGNRNQDHDGRGPHDPNASRGPDAGPGHDHGEDIPRDLEKPKGIWVAVVLFGLVLLLGVLFAVGLLPRLKRNKDLRNEARAVEDAPPIVNATRPRRAQAVTDLVLPGTVLAWQDTGIYARVTGYVKEWRHDLGDNVKAGELLAVIDAPDVDQQLAQAQAQLGQSQASLQKAQADRDLAKVTLDRFEELFKISAVNQQQLDQTRAAYKSAESVLDQTVATIRRDEATVRQLTDEQSWERVTAPFNGKITARNINVGQLIMPGTTASNTSGGREMFHLAETDVVRVMVTVPQTFVTWVQPGEDAEVFFRDDPNHALRSKVSRYSGALDPSTRTLLTEVDVPNRGADRPLTPGMALQVKFSVKRNVPPLMVPESALIYNAQGTQLALVHQEGDKPTAHFQPITIGRDTGTEIEVLGGLEPNDVVITNPGERLVNDGPVKVASIATPPPPDKQKQGPGELGTPGATPPATQPAAAPGSAAPGNR